jgi:hypothetical protein
LTAGPLLPAGANVIKELTVLFRRYMGISKGLRAQSIIKYTRVFFISTKARTVSYIKLKFIKLHVSADLEDKLKYVYTEKKRHNILLATFRT